MNKKTTPPPLPLNETRILLVDDHQVLRYGLRRLLQQQPGWRVCAEAWNDETALEAVYRHEPHIVIMDVSLDGDDGLALSRTIRRQSPETRIIIYTMHDESTYAHQALINGATGYVMKCEPPENLLNAIAAIVERDGVSISRRMNDLVLRNLCDIEEFQEEIQKLSDRERQVLALIADGLSCREIATQLGRSIKTIETHRSRIKDKLGIKSSSKLLLKAVEIFKNNPFIDDPTSHPQG